MKRQVLGALFAAMLAASCSSGDTSIVVSEIRDQDGRMLTTPVRIFVDGEATQCVPGDPCTIEVPDVPEGGRNVTIEADAGPDYSQITPRIHQVRSGQQYPLQLNMFRGYSVRIVVEDESMNPVSGVEVWSNDRLLGITDEFGQYSWGINDKTIRQGHVVDIEVASTEIPRQSLRPPVTITAGQYEYERVFSTGGAPVEEDVVEQVPQEPSPPSLAVRSDPAGVDVVVRSPSGSTFRIVSNDSRRVDPGRYTYTVDNVPEGWEVNPLEGSITVGGAGRHTIRLTMNERGGSKTLAINLEPAGGELVVRGSRTGKEYRVRENGPIKVVPDFYSWEVTAPPSGYSGLASSDLIDLINLDEATISETLPLEPDVNAFEACDQMYDERRYADAERMCLAVPEPRAGETSENYVDAQYTLGLIRFVHQDTRNIRAAVDNFQNVLEYEPQDYNAKFYLGMAHLEAGNLTEAREHFRWIQMNLLLIPTESRAARNFEALYYLALCDYGEYEATTDSDLRSRRAEDARLAFLNFLRQSEESTSSEVARLREDASQKVEYLSGQAN